MINITNIIEIRNVLITTNSVNEFIEKMEYCIETITGKEVIDNYLSSVAHLSVLDDNNII